MTSQFIDLLESQLGRFRAEADYLIGRERGSDVLLETWLKTILHDPVAYQFAARNMVNLSASFLALILISSELREVDDIHIKLDEAIRSLARAFDADELMIRQQILLAQKTLERLLD
jgi:hypothetical protein